MSRTHSDRTVFYVRLSTDGVVRSIGRTMAVALDSMRQSFPIDAIREITEDEHKLYRGKRGLRLVDGVFALDDPAPPDPERLRQAAVIRLDRDAEHARAAFLTSGMGQALEYIITLAEAQAAEAAEAAGAEATEEDYPMLTAERAARRAVGRQDSLLTVANDIQARALTCAHGLAHIKRVRRSAKLMLERAATLEAIQAVIDAVIWPQPVRD